jgi:hypothetical protein
MADDNRTVERDRAEPVQAQANRRRAQGLGMDEREVSPRRDPDQIPQTPLALDADDDLRSEPGDEQAVLHANHARRGAKTAADRIQGAKTRAAHKDQVSRR